MDSEGFNFFLQTNITRFGTVLFLIFVLSILISLYRYILKLAAFYASRADALALALVFEDTDVMRFNSIVESMKAESIEFKEAKLPIEQVAKLKNAFDGK